LNDNVKGEIFMNALKKSIALFVALLLLTNVWVPTNSYAAGGGDDYIFTVAGNDVPAISSQVK
jgi:hypothetical protein